MLYYTIICYTILYYTILYYTILYYTIVSTNTILHYMMLYCITQYDAVGTRPLTPLASLARRATPTHRPSLGHTTLYSRQAGS